MFEGIATAILLIVIGAIPVVPRLLDGGTWGAEPSVGAVLMGLGTLALWIELAARLRKEPRR
jgi:hypothetical protein